MLSVERRTMIDQVWLPLADHQVRITMRAIGIRYERIEPHNPRSKFGRDVVSRSVAVEVEGAVQISRANVYAVTRPQKILNLGIGLRPSK